MHQRRSAGEVADFDVHLYFELQFVHEMVALQFESLDNSNSNIVHFCNAVRDQVNTCHFTLDEGLKGHICKSKNRESNQPLDFFAI